MANTNDAGNRAQSSAGRHLYLYLAVLLFAGAVYLASIISPPSLMDDVDAVQAQIARTMLTSGDWVTARLDGVAYLEKSPLIYWMIAVAYKIFGMHDWAARIPVALSAMGLCWLTAAFGIWAFGRRAGFYAGLVVATCIGLFLFTRVLIPDVMLTLTIALGMWAFLRALDEEERSEEHTSELQSLRHLVCRLLLEKKNNKTLQRGRLPLAELLTLAGIDAHGL